ncbi:response regulator transcription factor [Actinomycetaceae bacterium L2_0104]
MRDASDQASVWDEAEPPSTLRLAVIDDHEIVALGVRGAYEAVSPEKDVKISWYSSVERMSQTPDVAILDLRLDDGTAPADNLEALLSMRVPVVVYTSADDPYLVREAIRHGALSVVRKSAAPTELVTTVEAALNNEITPGLDWAAALDADSDFVATHLTDVEAEVLAHYAAGELSEAVARRLGLAPSSVNTYISRIRKKYREAGRRVDSRVDLFFRAVEDGLVSYFVAKEQSSAPQPQRGERQLGRQRGESSAERLQRLSGTS